MIEDFARQDVLSSVDRVIEEVLTAAGMSEPPIDTITLARDHLGIEVCLDRGQKQRGRAQRSAGREQIFLKPEPTEERHQWTVAHEIGEHLKPTLLERLGTPPEEARAMAGESLANLLAHHLLVPTRWFQTDAPSMSYDLLALKERYRTASHEVLALRMLDLPEPCVISIIDNDHLYRRRSNAWQVQRRLESPEQRCQHYVHDYGRPKLVQDGGWTVYGWPVHRIEWKREILRSQKDDWYS
jgi:Zn-dependent peptidase ImmA (M78 family)